MEKELHFDLTVETNALLCPNPTEFYSRAYVTDNIAGNFRLLPNVKYKTKLAVNQFGRALYPSKTRFEDIADSTLDAMDIDVVAVSAMASVNQFTMETSFFSTAIGSGSNHANFTPQAFISHYWTEMANKVSEECALTMWQGDTALSAEGDLGFLANVDGFEKKLIAAESDIVSIQNAAITKANVIAEMSKVYNGLPTALKHKTDDLRFYVSANVGAAYLEAVAENNTILYTTMNPQLTWLGRIQIVIQEGMTDNTMLLTRFQNLIYAFDAINDKDQLKAVNLTDTVAEPELRTRVNLKYGFYLAVGNEGEIVYYFDIPDGE